MVFIGLLTFVFVFTTYRVPIGDVAMAVALAGLLFQKKKLVLAAPVVWFALFVAWAGVGYLGVDPRGDFFGQNASDLSRQALFDLGKLCLIMLVTLNALRSQSQIRFFMVFFLGLFATHPARGTIFNYAMGITEQGRVAWNLGFGDPNDMAALTLLQLGIASALLVSERQRLIRLGAIASVAVLPVVVLLTQSRGGFLGLAGFGIFAMWGRMTAKKLIPISLVVAGAIIFAPAGLWERLGTLRQATDVEALEDVEDSGSAEARWNIWRVSTRIIRDYPVTGSGIGIYQYTHWQYSGKDRTLPWHARGPRDTHSTYLNVMAETGFFGFLFFAGILLSATYRAEVVRRRARRVLPRYSRQLYFLEVGLFAYLIAGIFGSYARLPFLYVHVALLFALATAVARELSRLKQVAPDAPPPQRA